MSDPNDGRRAFLIQTAANVAHLVRLNLKIIITEGYKKSNFAGDCETAFALAVKFALAQLLQLLL